MISRLACRICGLEMVVYHQTEHPLHCQCPRCNSFEIDFKKVDDNTN